MRMSHIGICVSDWNRSVRFYHDRLGFGFIDEHERCGPAAASGLRLPEASVHAAFLERDGVRIELLHFRQPLADAGTVPRPMNRLGLTHLCLRVDDLETLLAELAEKGVGILDSTRTSGPGDGREAVFITDPDGTLIELVQSAGD